MTLDDKYELCVSLGLAIYFAALLLSGDGAPPPIARTNSIGPVRGTPARTKRLTMEKRGQGRVHPETNGA